VLQQFPSKCLVSPAPASTKLFPIRIILLRSSLLHLHLKPPPSGSTVLWDSYLTHQSIHSQPSRTAARLFQILQITAPGILTKPLIGFEQFGPHRIEVDVIAN